MCGTLVSLNSLSDEELVVKDDETDFYGKQYWLQHQDQDLGFPDIHARARYDLTERNLHWLKTLLRYSLPPAKVLELGCSHGSFVALMQQTGYAAAGLEMSQWVVSFGQDTFGIPMHLGPVEETDIPPGSLDVIALMDVLEHLPDPEATLRHCAKLLKSDGFLLIQTPHYQPEVTYQDLEASQSRFLEQLKADEHLYLFSQGAVQACLKRAGFEHVYYEPAIFDVYDMALIASKVPRTPNAQATIEAALLSHPHSRMSLALLDLRERELALLRDLDDSRKDGADRLKQIHVLTAQLQESQQDRADRLQQVHTLTAQLQASEQDRADRLEQVQTLTQLLQVSEQDRADRLQQIQTLTQQLRESEQERESSLKQMCILLQQFQQSMQERQALREEVDRLTQGWQDADRDRAEYLTQVQHLTHYVKDLEEKLTHQQSHLQTLQQMLQESEQDRAARFDQIQALTNWLKEARGEA
ncbi:MAG: methyltransferase domain-containing protein [Spirulina sp.]